MQLPKILLTVFVFATASCGDRPAQMDESKNVALQKIAAMNSHDLDALGKLYADSARIQSLGFEATEIGPGGIKSIYTRYLASTPDLKFEIDRITTADGSVVIEYTSSGTMQQSPLEAVIPEYMIGKKYTLRNCTRLDLKNGKITGEMTYFDQLSFLRQMGFFEQK